MSNKKFSYDDLTELVRQVENIKKKSLLNEIRDIIFNTNQNLKYTENSNGIYFHFHNLNQETYIKLDKFLKKNKHLISDDETTDNYFETKINKDKDEIDFLNGFSNREKNLIKRRLYDNAITKNSEMPNNSDNESNSDSESSNKSDDYKLQFSPKNNSSENVEDYIDNKNKNKSKTKTMEKKNTEKINTSKIKPEKKSPKTSVFLKKNTVK